MQAVILAAGRGKRMRNLTDKNNKNMLHVGGYPILKHKLDLLPEEIDEVIFVIGYQGNKIRREFGNSYKGRKITYVEQKRLNGTGGAIHRAKKLLKGKFLVMYGDDLYDKGDVQKIIKYDLAILAKKVKDVSKFGILKTDKKGNLKEIKEKPKRSKSKLAAIGLFMLNKNFFKFKLVSVGNGEYGLPQTLASMAKEFDIKILEARRWYPIGTPEDLENAQMAIKRFV
ncbi:MAG TPA: sugar phosphate nucleotidyltransferase [Candidatus Moranbacteria bacterium]|jgi:bifunctional UDP-N-acetylglucosamine pyrophosphorylase/glucosamine-1-phosphate N-acetyltransferase|nr:NTP transferase domain-containing protein [Candidatus Moranbacteria bacterium]HOF42366.1 sugar phosphate nucleotidyltransferase [Candidatus Moranbacteria bacterium]HPX94460.1 sugar phosphate nucleotidyltransferase [Candidatus Moranbacteria bacterium]HQB59637.1 sugar phosphate nucleotidyltransferase [Candidatus Moranbacteria bacterium]